MKLLSILLCVALMGCGGAMRHHRHRDRDHELPSTGDPVPGHPGYHFGPEHLQCDAQNNCEVVRNWLSDKDNKPVLSPVGCFIAKYLIFTRALGDKPSMCEHK